MHKKSQRRREDFNLYGAHTQHSRWPYMTHYSLVIHSTQPMALHDSLLTSYTLNTAAGPA